MSFKTRKELLDICKENNIRKVSNKKKEDIISILNQNKIFFQKKEVTNIEKNNYKETKETKEIRETIENKVLDKKDPISLEPFDEWTDNDFKNGIFMNGYYYKNESIKHYIQSKKKDKIPDPINPSLFIPDEIIQSFQKEEDILSLKEGDIQLEYENCYLNIEFHYFSFTLLYLKIIPTQYKVNTNLRYNTHKNRYFIGCIPNNISLCSWEEYPYEIKALDTSSTTESLIIRISELYKNSNLIDIKNNKINIKKIKSLPIKPFHWFSFYNGFFCIDTTPIENRNSLSIYNSLLEELENYS